MRVWLGLAVTTVLAGTAWASEPVCYRSTLEAAQQQGVRGTEGYRLESLRRDVFSGTTWATVKSCGHPEQPGVLVLASAGSVASAVATRYQTAAAKSLVMMAGTRVRFVETSENVRLEVSAVALASAAVGDTVRVRLAPVGTASGFDGGSTWGTEERFATGVVRSRDLVELETR